MSVASVIGLTAYYETIAWLLAVLMAVINFVIAASDNLKERWDYDLDNATWFSKAAVAVSTPLWLSVTLSAGYVVRYVMANNARDALVNALLYYSWVIYVFLIVLSFLVGELAVLFIMAAGPERCPGHILRHHEGCLNHLVHEDITTVILLLAILSPVVIIAVVFLALWVI